MTTAFDFQLQALDGAPLPLDRFKERPLLIVNTASACVFTPQYAALQSLWDDLKDRGLVVLAVPSNDFRGQEPGTANEISAFCRGSYGVTFPMAAKVSVKGAAADPLFQWLAREGGFLARPRWNFYKYLIGRDGRLATWFSCFTPPDASRVRRAVEAALGVEETI